MNSRDQLDRILAERVLVLDGAMGTMLQRHRLTEQDVRGQRFASHPHDLAGNYDVLVLTQPDVVTQIHRQYLTAGADIIETNTFNSNAISQGAYALEACIYELNVEGARLARQAAAEFTATDPGRPRFVAGSIGPTNRRLSISPDVDRTPFSRATFDALKTGYVDQIRGLIDGGADLLLIETIVDVLNAQAALQAIREVQDARGTDLPVMISLTITERGRTLDGQTLAAFYASMEPARPWSIGINCGFGARAMRPYIAELARVADCWVSAHPNAGLPNALGEYDQTPPQIAEELRDVAQSGFANILGGCCGTTPDHVARLSEAIRSLAPRRLPDRTGDVMSAGRERPLLPLSAARANHLKTDWDTLQIPTPWFIGRRVVEPPLEQLLPYINWTPVFSARGLEGRFPAILDHAEYGGRARELHGHLQTILQRIVREKRLGARGVYGFWPANTKGDDIVVYKDDARQKELGRFHMLRQQESSGAQPNRSLADFIAPRASMAPDYVGAFVVTAGIGGDDVVHEYERAHDDHFAAISRAVADRLTEAFAELLHARARKDWGYAADERLSPDELIAGAYRGIRLAFGVPACPDPSENLTAFTLLDASAVGIELTDSFSMTPAASVGGIYLSHPEAKDFNVGPIGVDQVEDYAVRKGVTRQQVERWLAPNLGY